MEAVERRVLLSSYAIASINLGPPLPDSPVVLDAAGDLFGTTMHGGPTDDGTVYEIPHGGTAAVTLASFNGANGSGPTGVVLDAAGNLFGATEIGGAANSGSVFEIAAGTHTITTLASFNGSGGGGTDPYAGVTLDAAGDVFGTTFYGGTSGAGTIFEVAAGSNTVTTLASFNSAVGVAPRAGVTLDANGDLFGTAAAGGAGGNSDGLGTVWELPAGANQITALASFLGANGQVPFSGVTLDPAGNLFGTTTGGGANKDGTVYEIARATTGGTGGSGSYLITTLASFNGANGVGSPAGSGGTTLNSAGGANVTLDSAGNLFGTTPAGGATGHGTIFEIPHAAAGSALTTLVSFNGADGEAPAAGVTFDPAGNLFGTTASGGAHDVGTVYEVPAAALANLPAPPTGGADPVTTLTSFTGDNARLPNAGVTLDAAGDAFGTTQFGSDIGGDPGQGRLGNGTVYEVAAGTNTLTTLVSFNGANGSQPSAGVALDSAGNLFGTTQYGGPDNDGVVYEIARGSGAITALASFNGKNGSIPYGGVALDAAGDLFGTTEYGSAGSASGYGTVYEIAAGSNAITTLASFDSTNGAYPQSAVKLDSAGDLFGTTQGNGTDGTVFEIAHATSGGTTLTTLATLTQSSGASPLGGVTLDAAGNLFGTAVSGGANDDGTVYEIARGTKATTVLASFNGFNGRMPYAGVSLDAAGNLFGTTILGGPYGLGTVYELPRGSTTLTTLFGFDGRDGYYSSGGVTPDTSGDLLGTTLYGGPASAGTIFKLAPAPATALACPPVSTTYGAPTTLTATLTSGGTPLPGRTVAFLLPDGTLLGKAVTGADGVASLPFTDNLDASGPHPFVAAFGGDAAYGASQSPPQTLTVAKADTTAKLTASVNPAGTGQSVTFTATLTAATPGAASNAAQGPTGTVAFYNGTTPLGTAPVNNFGTADLTTSFFTTGADDITASYAGDTNYNPSASAAVHETVNPAPPEVQSVTPQDPLGNGSPTGIGLGGQRSQVTRFVVVFNEPVTLAGGAFTLGLVNNYGSGANNGSPDTDVSAVLGTPTNPSNDGRTWVVPVVQSGASTTYSYALSSGGAGLQDGVYRLTVNASAVSASPAAGGLSPASSYTTLPFHRLFGDADGNESVNAADYARFKSAFGSASGSSAYNIDLDFDGNGAVNALDYAQFKKRFGRTFTY